MCASLAMSQMASSAAADQFSLVQCTDKAAEYENVKIIVLGASGVGKTSILLRFKHLSFEEGTASTIGIDYIPMRMMTNPPAYDRPTAANFWDTAGQERFANTVRAFTRGANGAIVVFDATKPSTFQHATDALESLRDGSAEAVVVLVANKLDLYRRSVESRSLPAWLSERDFDEDARRRGFDAGFASVSAKTGEGIEHMMVRLTDLAVKRKLKAQAQFDNDGGDDPLSLQRNDSPRIKCCSGTRV